MCMAITSHTILSFKKISLPPPPFLREIDRDAPFNADVNSCEALGPAKNNSYTDQIFLFSVMKANASCLEFRKAGEGGRLSAYLHSEFPR